MGIFDTGLSGPTVTEPAKRRPWAPTPAPAPVTGTKDPTPDPTEAKDRTYDPTYLFDELRVMFPWLDQIGIDPEWFQEVAAETLGNPDAALVKFRQLPQYKARFPGLWRQDGSLRMNEREYLETEEAYRSLLRQSGIDESTFKSPSDLVGFFESEIDPNELGERLQVYRDVRDNSQEVRDAFYVYAGIDLSVDDLFEAVVDERIGDALRSRYRESIAQNPLDYPTYITRASEVANRRVANLVADPTNPITDSTLQRVGGDNSTALLDLLHTGGGDGPPLALEELLAAYEEALIGGAATSAGLRIPTKERVAELRMAGVQRAQARQAYLEFARLGGSLSGGSQRAGLGGVDQDRFERGVFLGEGDAMKALQTATAYEESAGIGGGRFQFDQGRYGRLRQRGLET